jgi:CheY-like chemotaxis protein
VSVLVVDDDKSARSTLAIILRRHSLAVSEAGSVAEAIQRLADRPDWVLLDLMLPDGSGCDVLSKLADQGHKSRVCVVSGAGPALMERARKLGPQHVLSKPLDLGRLMSILGT